MYVHMAFLSMLLVLVAGHGRLWDPPGRSTAWRRGFPNPINYQDNELYCGGRAVRKHTFCLYFLYHYTPYAYYDEVVDAYDGCVVGGIIIPHTNILTFKFEFLLIGTQ